MERGILLLSPDSQNAIQKEIVMWPEIVKIERSYNKSPIDSVMGVRLAQSGELSLVEVVDQLIIPNGFSVIRNALISKIAPERNSAILGAGLQLKGFSPSISPKVDLRSMKHCLEMFRDDEVFLSAFFERTKPDVAYLGKIHTVKGGKFELRPVSPSARWLREEKTFVIDECTRIDFFGEYERAIYLSSLHFGAHKRAK
jgi:hypothetical protein